MPAGGSRLDRLQGVLDYRFADISLLEQALTHTSAVAPSRRTAKSYQRLEFLGDRVLGLVVADALLDQHAKANEGTLSRALNSVVRKESCADVARALDLGRFLNLGESEARTGGADKTAILGDACEALIGAIYTDGGLEPARALVLKHFAEYLGSGVQSRGDAKTALQEWAQGQGLEPPVYEPVRRTGPDHAPMFTIEVRLDGYQPHSAKGNSKKIAEHQAAEGFLQREKVWPK